MNLHDFYAHWWPKITIWNPHAPTKPHLQYFDLTHWVILYLNNPASITQHQQPNLALYKENNPTKWHNACNLAAGSSKQPSIVYITLSENAYINAMWNMSMILFLSGDIKNQPLWQKRSNTSLASVMPVFKRLGMHVMCFPDAAVRENWNCKSYVSPSMYTMPLSLPVFTTVAQIHCSHQTLLCAILTTCSNL